MSEAILFEAKGISKSFGATRALIDVDIVINKGEIHGLIGENGSGKSTLSTICSGIQRADQGEMFLAGESYIPNGTVDAMNKGVSMVVQEQGTVAGISVAANVFFGRESLFVKYGVLNVKKMNAEAKRVLTELGMGHIEPAAMIDSLSFEDRKLVEMARSLYTAPKLWIIDETTTALTVNGREILYGLMEHVKERGGAVLFISHDIDEIMDKCDSLTILRDGALTAYLKKDEFDDDKIKQLMIGRDLSGHYYREDERETHGDEVVLRMDHVETAFLKDICFELYKGEILGIGGLSDCGMHDIGRLCFGLDRPEAGEVKKNETQVVKSAEWSVENGIAYISKNRDKESLMTICTIRDNICLPSLKDLSKHGFILKRSEKKLAETWAENMEVKAESVDQYCSALSGGNKQKVVLAKWLAKDSDIMIMDCPTRGIDIGTKASIYELMEKLKKEGKSIILISEEMSELIGLSDRIVILKDGQISGVFSRSEGLTEAKLIQKMV